MTKPMIDFSMIGTMVPQSPINISHPDSPEDKKGVPTMPVVLAGGIAEMPYIPGATIKGLLRATTADLATRNRRMGLDVYNILYKGGIKGSEKEGLENLRRNDEFRRSSPVLGLYGAASPMWLAGCLAFLPALPMRSEDYAISEQGGARLDDMRLDPERLSKLEDKAVDDYFAYAQVVKDAAAKEGEIEAHKRSIMKLKREDQSGNAAAISALSETIKAEEAALKEIRSSDSFKNVIGRPLPVRKGIAVGSILHQRIEGRGVLDAEFGLFLEAVRSLQDDCRIGGMRTIGYGYFAAEWRLKVRRVGGEFEDAGSISVSRDGFSLKSDHPVVAEALAAWKDTQDGHSGVDAFLAAGAGKKAKATGVSA